MRLLPIPDESGKPQLWINADHLVSVQAQYRTDGVRVTVLVELKLEGMPLQRLPLGEHLDRASAESAFEHFVAELQEQG